MDYHEKAQFFHNNNFGVGDNKPGEIFPWLDVLASREKKSLQKNHSLKKAINNYLKGASPCPKCKLPPESQPWP